MTAREFINIRFPEFEKLSTSDLKLDGDTVMQLIEEYHLYKRILEKTGNDGKNVNNNPDNYDHYH